MPGGAKAQGVSTRGFIEFRQLIVIYEKQLDKPNSHLNTAVQPTLHKVSIEDSDLAIFFATKWIQGESLEAIPNSS